MASADGDLGPLGTSVPWTSPQLPPSSAYNGAFRDNVQEFLKTCGVKVSLRRVRKIAAWVVPLKDAAGTSVNLHVYEESVAQDKERVPVCDCCRNMGWQNHPVCNRKYHFIIPGLPDLADALQLPTIVEAKFTGMAVSDFKGPSHTDKDEDPFNSPAGVFESKSHNLHGTLHANGFGHLQRMNARVTTDPKTSLTGQQLMTIWDSLCVLLAARDVSVEDVSNKGGMLLRTLHPVANGTTWYGKWGYDFGRSPFNVGNEQYSKCVNVLRNLLLEDLYADFDRVDSSVQHILQQYTRLSVPRSPGYVHSFGSLLQRMLVLLSCPVEQLQQAVLLEERDSRPAFLDENAVEVAPLAPAPPALEDAPPGAPPPPPPLTATAGPAEPSDGTVPPMVAGAPAAAQAVVDEPTPTPPPPAMAEIPPPPPPLTTAAEPAGAGTQPADTQPGMQQADAMPAAAPAGPATAPAQQTDDLNRGMGSGGAEPSCQAMEGVELASVPHAEAQPTQGHATDADMHDAEHGIAADVNGGAAASVSAPMEQPLAVPPLAAKDHGVPSTPQAMAVDDAAAAVAAPAAPQQATDDPVPATCPAPAVAAPVPVPPQEVSQAATEDDTEAAAPAAVQPAQVETEPQLATQPDAQPEHVVQPDVMVGVPAATAMSVENASTASGMADIAPEGPLGPAGADAPVQQVLGSDAALVEAPGVLPPDGAGTDAAAGDAPPAAADACVPALGSTGTQVEDPQPAPDAATQAAPEPAAAIPAPEEEPAPVKGAKSKGRGKSKGKAAARKPRSAAAHAKVAAITEPSAASTAGEGAAPVTVPANATIAGPTADTTADAAPSHADADAAAPASDAVPDNTAAAPAEAEAAAADTARADAAATALPADVAAADGAAGPAPDVAAADGAAGPAPDTSAAAGVPAADGTVGPSTDVAPMAGTKGRGRGKQGGRGARKARGAQRTSGRADAPHGEADAPPDAGAAVPVPTTDATDAPHGEAGAPPDAGAAVPAPASGRASRGGSRRVSAAGAQPTPVGGSSRKRKTRGKAAAAEPQEDASAGQAEGGTGAGDGPAPTADGDATPAPAPASDVQASTAPAPDTSPAAAPGDAPADVDASAKAEPGAAGDAPADVDASAKAEPGGSSAARKRKPDPRTSHTAGASAKARAGAHAKSDAGAGAEGDAGTAPIDAGAAPISGTSAPAAAAVPGLTKVPFESLKALELDMPGSRGSNPITVQRLLQATIDALEAGGHGTWMSKPDIRMAVAHVSKDRGLVDAVINRIGNVRVGGFALYGAEGDKVRFLCVERIAEGEPQGPDIDNFTVRFTPAGKPQVVTTPRQHAAALGDKASGKAGRRSSAKAGPKPPPDHSAAAPGATPGAAAGAGTSGAADAAAQADAAASPTTAGSPGSKAPGAKPKRTRKPDPRRKPKSDAAAASAAAQAEAEGDEGAAPAGGDAVAAASAGDTAGAKPPKVRIRNPKGAADGAPAANDPPPVAEGGAAAAALPSSAVPPAKVTVSVLLGPQRVPAAAVVPPTQAREWAAAMVALDEDIPPPPPALASDALAYEHGGAGVAAYSRRYARGRSLDSSLAMATGLGRIKVDAAVLAAAAAAAPLPGSFAACTTFVAADKHPALRIPAAVTSDTLPLLAFYRTWGQPEDSDVIQALLTMMTSARAGRSRRSRYAFDSDEEEDFMDEFDEDEEEEEEGHEFEEGDTEETELDEDVEYGDDEDGYDMGGQQQRRGDASRMRIGAGVNAAEPKPKPALKIVTSRQHAMLARAEEQARRQEEKAAKSRELAIKRREQRQLRQQGGMLAGGGHNPLEAWDPLAQFGPMPGLDPSTRKRKAAGDARAAKRVRDAPPQHLPAGSPGTSATVSDAETEDEVPWPSGSVRSAPYSAPPRPRSSRTSGGPGRSGPGRGTDAGRGGRGGRAPGSVRLVLSAANAPGQGPGRPFPPAPSRRQAAGDVPPPPPPLGGAARGAKAWPQSRGPGTPWAEVADVDAAFVPPPPPPLHHTDTLAAAGDAHVVDAGPHPAEAAVGLRRRRSCPTRLRNLVRWVHMRVQIQTDTPSSRAPAPKMPDVAVAASLSVFEKLPRTYLRRAMEFQAAPAGEILPVMRHHHVANFIANRQLAGSHGMFEPEMPHWTTTLPGTPIVLLSSVAVGDAASAAVMDAGAAGAAKALRRFREQVQADLQYLYCHTVREYTPALMAMKELARGVAPGDLRIRLRQLPHVLQVLQDTKCFVKAYPGPFRQHGMPALPSPEQLASALPALPAPSPAPHSPAPTPSARSPAPMPGLPTGTAPHSPAVPSMRSPVPMPPAAAAPDSAPLDAPTAMHGVDSAEPAPSHVLTTAERASADALNAATAAPTAAGDDTAGGASADALATPGPAPAHAPACVPTDGGDAAPVTALAAAQEQPSTLPAPGSNGAGTAPPDGTGGAAGTAAAPGQQPCSTAATTPPAASSRATPPPAPPPLLGSVPPSLPGPSYIPPSSASLMRLLIQVVGLQDTSPAAELAAKNAIPRAHTAQPPPEVVIVPDPCTVRVVRRAASRALADMYRMFSSKCVGTRTVMDRPEAPSIEVSRVVGGLPPDVAALGDDGQVSGLPDGHVLLVAVANFNAHQKWRHAGGQEDWVVWCEVCGASDDDGERMVACDLCGIWKHTRCSGIPDDEPEPEMFKCASCRAGGRAARAEKKKAAAAAAIASDDADTRRRAASKERRVLLGAALEGDVAALSGGGSDSDAKSGPHKRSRFE